MMRFMTIGNTHLIIGNIGGHVNVHDAKLLTDGPVDILSRAVHLSFLSVPNQRLKDSEIETHYPSIMWLQR
jgi:hypothetical protein